MEESSAGNKGACQAADRSGHYSYRALLQRTGVCQLFPITKCVRRDQMEDFRPGRPGLTLIAWRRRCAMPPLVERFYWQAPPCFNPTTRAAMPFPSLFDALTPRRQAVGRGDCARPVAGRASKLDAARRPRIRTTSSPAGACRLLVVGFNYRRPPLAKSCGSTRPRSPMTPATSPNGRRPLERFTTLAPAIEARASRLPSHLPRCSAIGPASGDAGRPSGRHRFYLRRAAWTA